LWSEATSTWLQVYHSEKGWWAYSPPCSRGVFFQSHTYGVRSWLSTFLKPSSVSWCFAQWFSFWPAHFTPIQRMTMPTRSHPTKAYSEQHSHTEVLLWQHTVANAAKNKCLKLEQWEEVKLRVSHSRPEVPNQELWQQASCFWHGTRVFTLQVMWHAKAYRQRMSAAWKGPSSNGMPLQLGTHKLEKGPAKDATANWRLTFY